MAETVDFPPVTLTLDISDEALAELRFGREDLRREAKKELALAFYARGFVSLGKAVEIAETSRMLFERWLVDRKIERPFSEEELEKEISWADSSRGCDGSEQAAQRLGEALFAVGCGHFQTMRIRHGFISLNH